MAVTARNRAAAALEMAGGALMWTGLLVAVVGATIAWHVRETRERRADRG